MDRGDMSRASVDVKDIQGIVRFGFGPLKDASFWLQVAFTREGLEALGVAGDVVAGFSAEFLSGMAGEASRSRRLGDVGANSPEWWKWGSARNVPHMLMMLYAQQGQLDKLTRSIQSTEWNSAFEALDCLTTSNLQGTEPFGFNDGISQPALDWTRQRRTQGDEL